jgi:hypothetical protein
MLGVVLCNVMALPAILKYAKERFPGIKVYLEPFSKSGTKKSPSASLIAMHGTSEDRDRASVLTEPLPVYHPSYNPERGLNGDFDSHHDESWTEERILPWSPSDRDIEKQ